MVIILSPLQFLDIKVHYSTDSDKGLKSDLIEDFFIPCLKNSVKYDRISAFYSSYVLIYLFKGIKEFVANGGKMRLLLGCIPSREFEVVNDIERKKYYEEDFIERLLNDDEISEKVLKKSVIQLFAWLLDKGYLEIKLGFIVNDHGELESEKEIKIALNHGMLHDKQGIFTDKDGNKIGFIGSLNETPKGFFEHSDSITIFKSWKIYQDEQDNEHLKAIIDEFNRFWNNRGNRLRVFRLPDESLKRITNNAPNDFPEEDYKIINAFYRKTERKIPIEKLEPLKGEIQEDFCVDPNFPFRNIIWYEPQKLGYEKWIENQKRGILAIATGVGKTLIAIRAIYEFFKEEVLNKKMVIIVVPDNLALQWKDELKSFIFDKLGNNFAHLSFLISIKTGMAVKSKLILLKKVLKTYKKNIIIAYYNTFIKKIIPLINSLDVNREILLVADEVHEMGTKLRMDKFRIFHPDFRLGLSATPIRQFDIEGTEFIESYFSGTIYRYTISEAIDDGYLCPYNYYPLFYELTDEELSYYIAISKKIFAKEKELNETGDKILSKLLKKEKELLTINRKRIIKKAENKLPLLRDILINLQKSGDIYYSLIYVEDESQLIPVISILEDLSIRYEVIVQDVDPIERQEIIKRFENKQTQVILAEKILDQGVNIRVLRTGIFLSSTVNERQYIQRRGRLLRKFPGKEVAHIYDFISIEKSVLGELRRAKIFYEDCNNKYEVFQLFEEKGINLNELAFNGAR